MTVISYTRAQYRIPRRREIFRKISRKVFFVRVQNKNKRRPLVRCSGSRNINIFYIAIYRAWIRNAAMSCRANVTVSNRKINILTISHCVIQISNLPARYTIFTRPNLHKTVYGRACATGCD